MPQKSLCRKGNPPPPCEDNFYEKINKKGAKCCYKTPPKKVKKKTPKKSPKIQKKSLCRKGNPPPPCEGNFYERINKKGAKCCYKTPPKKVKKKSPKKSPKIQNKIKLLNKNEIIDDIILIKNKKMKLLGKGGFKKAFKKNKNTVVTIELYNDLYEPLNKYKQKLNRLHSLSKSSKLNLLIPNYVGEISEIVFEYSNKKLNDEYNKFFKKIEIDDKKQNDIKSKLKKDKKFIIEHLIGLTKSDLKNYGINDNKNIILFQKNIKKYNQENFKKLRMLKMPLCKTGDLYDYLLIPSRINQLSKKTIFTNLINLLTTVHELHKKNISCLDIKPENTFTTCGLGKNLFILGDVDGFSFFENKKKMYEHEDCVYTPGYRVPAPGKFRLKKDITDSFGGPNSDWYAILIVTLTVYIKKKYGYIFTNDNFVNKLDKISLNKKAKNKLKLINNLHWSDDDDINEFKKFIDKLSKEKISNNLVIDTITKAIISCGKEEIYNSNSKYFWENKNADNKWYSDFIEKIIIELEKDI